MRYRRRRHFVTRSPSARYVADRNTFRPLVLAATPPRCSIPTRRFWNSNRKISMRTGRTRARTRPAIWLGCCIGEKSFS
jgi:hypothetical protein